MSLWNHQMVQDFLEEEEEAEEGVEEVMKDGI